MPNHRGCFDSREPSLLNFPLLAKITKSNLTFIEEKGNTMSFPRKQNCRTSSVIYQKTEDEQSKHPWAHRDTQTFLSHRWGWLGDCQPQQGQAGSSPCDDWTTMQPSVLQTSCQTKPTLRPLIVPISCLQVKTSLQNFSDSVNLFIFCSNLSTNCFFFTLHWS